MLQIGIKKGYGFKSDNMNLCKNELIYIQIVLILFTIKPIKKNIIYN